MAREIREPASESDLDTPQTAKSHEDTCAEAAGVRLNRR
jgi:hypothetical protein